jgi:hypothetical protein
MLVIASYVGFGAAVATIAVFRGGYAALPLIMMFCTAIALRAAFTIPTDVDANWTFRLRTPHVVTARRATRQAIMLLAVCPIVVLFAGAAAAAGWPAARVGRLVVVNLATGALLVEALLLEWTKIPFTCAHVPATDTLKARSLQFLGALGVFAVLGTQLHNAAAASTVRAGGFFGAALLLLALLRHGERRRFRGLDVPFDSPEDAVETLGLSEALR